MKRVVLNDWSEFEERLRSKLKANGHHWQVTVRNFGRISFDKNEEVDRFELAQSTGTDRDGESPFWNATGHDHDHDRQPRGKRPDEIIYAHTIDLDTHPYTVLHEAVVSDVTQALSKADAILVYDAAKLNRVSPNEYWFRTTPLDASLLILCIDEAEDA